MKICHILGLSITFGCLITRSFRFLSLVANGYIIVAYEWISQGFCKWILIGWGTKMGLFILASQAKQVFYVTDPKSTKWSIVLLSNKVIDDKSVDQGDVDVENESYIRNDRDENTTADETYIRKDHDEGIWINPSVRVLKRQVIQNPNKKRKI